MAPRTRWSKPAPTRTSFTCPTSRNSRANLRPDRLDGLILTGAMVNQFALAADTPAMKQLRKIPSVWVIGDPPGAWGDTVMADDFALGSGAAEQLVASGHRQLAFLNPVPDNLLFARREDGFYSAARRLGVEVRSFCQSPPSGWPLPLQAPTSRFDAVQSLIDQLLESTPRPTAVFAAADSVAALAYCVLGMRGMRVGHDISVIAGNNTPGLLSVPLSAPGDVRYSCPQDWRTRGAAIGDANRRT